MCEMINMKTMTHCFKCIVLAALTALPALPGKAQLVAQTQLAGRDIRVEKVRVTRHDGYAMLTLVLNLDSLDLRANTRLVYTPVIKAGDTEVTLPEIVINGRRQQIMYERGDLKKTLGDKAVVVSRHNGKPQRIDYQAVVPLESEVMDYDVDIVEDLCGCGDLLDNTRHPLRRYRQPQMAYVRPAAEAQKVRHIDKTAYIDFPVDRIELHADYRRNPAELDSIVQTINLVKEDKNLTIRHIEIHGFASPESPYSHNDYLARERAKTLKDYVRNLVSLDDSLFSVAHTPENWEGLTAYIRESNLSHKEEILAIIGDSLLDADAREWKIKRTYPQEYRFMLDTWYPALRRSDYHITYTVRPFNVEEARQLISSKPQQLSLEEMYRVAQTYEPGSDDFNAVMEVAVRMFPHDATANLNAACTRLQAGDADGAKPYLDKAGTSPEAVHARAVYAQMKGDFDEARQLYRQAAEAGVKQAQTNLDNL